MSNCPRMPNVWKIARKTDTWTKFPTVGLFKGGVLRASYRVDETGTAHVYDYPSGYQSLKGVDGWYIVRDEQAARGKCLQLANLIEDQVQDETNPGGLIS